MNWFPEGIAIGAGIGFFILGLEVVGQLRRIADGEGYQRADRLRYKIAEAYQIVGELARQANLFDDPAVIKALDHFADPDKFLDADLLPWYPETRDAEGNPVAAAPTEEPNHDHEP